MLKNPPWVQDTKSRTGQGGPSRNLRQRVRPRHARSPRSGPGHFFRITGSPDWGAAPPRPRTSPTPTEKGSLHRAYEAFCERYARPDGVHPFDHDVPPPRKSSPSGVSGPRWFTRVSRACRCASRSPLTYVAMYPTKARLTVMITVPMARIVGPLPSDDLIVGLVVPLTDVQRARIEPLLPDRAPRRGGRRRHHREVIDAAPADEPDDHAIERSCSRTDHGDSPRRRHPSPALAFALTAGQAGDARAFTHVMIGGVMGSPGAWLFNQAAERPVVSANCAQAWEYVAHLRRGARVRASLTGAERRRAPGRLCGRRGTVGGIRWSGRVSPRSGCRRRGSGAGGR